VIRYQVIRYQVESALHPLFGCDALGGEQEASCKYQVEGGIITEEPDNRMMFTNGTQPKITREAALGVAKLMGVKL
jgi:hypothetical protein